MTINQKHGIHYILGLALVHNIPGPMSLKKIPGVVPGYNISICLQFL